MENLISYVRVSTRTQGDKHGLDAQRNIIEDYISRNEARVIQEFCEIESGSNCNRPVLRNALNHCALTGSRLITPRLDRLARDLNFLTSIMDSGVEIIICDFPNASRFVVQILGCVAEYELMRIRERTKNGIKAAMQKGVKWGTSADRNRDLVKLREGSKVGSAVVKNRADEFAAKIKPVIQEYIIEGRNLSEIAGLLTENNILTARRKRNWTAQSVKNVIKRLNMVRPS